MWYDHVKRLYGHRNTALTLRFLCITNGQDSYNSNYGKYPPIYEQKNNDVNKRTICFTF